MSTRYLELDESRKFDIIFLGRVAVDFNPAYSELVKEEFKPLKKVHYFEKFVGGSPANTACGITRHGMKAGFFATVSADQLGDFVVDYFNEHGIDTSHIVKPVACYCLGSGEESHAVFAEYMKIPEE